MTTPNPPLDEPELKAILVGNVREFALSDAQRTRLQHRLEQGDGFDASGITVATVLPYDFSEQQQRRPRRFVVSMAASLVVAAGLLGAMRIREHKTPTELRTQIVPTDEAAVDDVRSSAQDARSFCEGEFVALDDAIRVWAGIENWSFLTDDRIPEPDLLQASINALSVLQELRPGVDTKSELDDLRKLDADRRPDDASDSLGTLTGSDRIAAEQAVQSAVNVLVSSADADTELANSGCHTDWYSSE